jgi:hypothetical protein
MSLGDPNPSPERDPRPSGSNPKRPTLLIRELDPIALEIPLENLDRLTDVLGLCGLTPNSETTEYMWKNLLHERLATIEEIQDHQGPLGLSLELDYKTKHELECRDDLEGDWGGYEERVSITLSTQHREGSELGALLNMSEGAPGLEGLFLELQATPLGEHPAIAHIYWDETGLEATTVDERWDLLRGFHHFFKGCDVPESVPLTPGQHERFHYLAVDLDPMIVRVQRLLQARRSSEGSNHQGQSHESPSSTVEMRMKEPPLSLVATLMSRTGALQIDSPWAMPNSPEEIVQHLEHRLHSLTKLDIDTLKMCAGAHPCIIFAREDTSAGDVFPPQIWSRVTMTDYTCAVGEFRLEFKVCPEDHHVEVLCRWHKANSRFSDIPWQELKHLARPYLLEGSDT